MKQVEIGWEGERDFYDKNIYYKVFDTVCSQIIEQVSFPFDYSLILEKAVFQSRCESLKSMV